MCIRDSIRTCGFATCCLTDGTSNLWTKWWRLLLPILLFIPFPSSSQYKSSQYPFHLLGICAASVKFSPVTDRIHCRHNWNFRVIDLTIWKSCFKFPFEFAASNSIHMPSSCCCLSTLSSLYLCLQFLMSVLIFAFCFSLFPDCCGSLIRYPFLFLLRLDGSNRSSGHLQQDCLGTCPEIFWGDLILCSLLCHKPVGHLCCKVYSLSSLSSSRFRGRMLCCLLASLTFSVTTSNWWSVLQSAPGYVRQFIKLVFNHCAIEM